MMLPMCGWSTSKLDASGRSTQYPGDNRLVDPRDQTTGLLNVDNIQRLLHSIALYPLTELKESVFIATEMSSQ